MDVREGYGNGYDLHSSLRNGPEINTSGLHVRRSIILRQCLEDR